MEEHSMTRAIFSHEVVDPDFQWLISNYVERRGGVLTVDVTGLPVVMIMLDENERAKVGGLQQQAPPLPMPQEETAEGRDKTPSE
jgi:hypothetical protein